MSWSDRRVRVVVGAMAVALAAGVLVVARGGRAPSPSTVQVAGEGETTTTTDATSTSTSTSTTVETTTTVPSGDAQTGDMAATTDTTAPPPVCRNSFDPRCGPFHWDPAPGPNQPLEITVEVNPAEPVVGEDVTFRIVIRDPDAPLDGFYAFEPEFTGFTGFRMAPEVAIGVPGDGPAPCAVGFGAWSPPPSTPGEVVVVKHWRYTAPYTYTGGVRYAEAPSPTGPDGALRPGAGERCTDPYASGSDWFVEFTVTVRDPNATTTSTTTTSTTAVPAG